jgi:hypothetical protein
MSAPAPVSRFFRSPQEPPQVFTLRVTGSNNTSGTITVSLDASTKTDEHRPSLLQALVVYRKILHCVDGIHAILGREGDAGLTLVVIVNHMPRESRRRIHVCEWELMQHYPETGFDFRVIELRDRPLDEVVSVQLYDQYLPA